MTDDITRFYGRAVLTAALIGVLTAACSPSAEHGHDHDDANQTHTAASETEHRAQESAGEDHDAHAGEDHAAHEADAHDHDHDDDSAEVRSAHKHVHGEGNLAIVTDENTISVELETPLYNLLGFEHAPENEEQRDAVRKAGTALSATGAVLSFNAEAGCREVKRDAVDISAHWEQAQKDHGHSHGEDSHTHKANHKNFVVSVNYVCDAPKKLRTADVSLFEAFPNFEEIDVVFLGPASQTALIADPKNTRLRLRG